MLIVIAIELAHVFSSVGSFKDFIPVVGPALYLKNSFCKKKRIYLVKNWKITLESFGGAGFAAEGSLGQKSAVWRTGSATGSLAQTFAILKNTSFYIIF